MEGAAGQGDRRGEGVSALPVARYIASPSGSLPWVTQSVFQVTGGASDATAAAPNDANVEFLGRCLGVHRNAMEQEPFILATAIAAKCLGA